MCGISGILSQKLSEDDLRSAVDRMNSCQSNRGPDDSGIVLLPEQGRRGSSASTGSATDFKVCLGHTRLSILDLTDAGHQPMGYPHESAGISIDQRCFITYNGEIYNFKELRADLEEKGYSLNTETDTEVILAGYREWGIDVVNRLRGMFAFALWDSTKEKLFLVRDRFGIKPIYYFQDRKNLVFASSVKALKESGIVPDKENPKSWIGFLLFGSVPHPYTTVKDVFSLSPGHYMEISPDGNTKTTQYYNVLPFFQRKSADMRSDSPNIDSSPSGDSAKQNRVSDLPNIVKKTRKLFEDSVAMRLISDAPLGIFLSGGIDSSVITLLASESMKESNSLDPELVEGLKTLSIDFEEGNFSERKYQDLVVEKAGSDHTRKVVTKDEFLENLDEAFEAMDQPTIDGINTYFVAKAAKDAGLKTVLSGLGGDEIFMGYDHFRRAGFIRSLQRVPLPFKTISTLSSKSSALNSKYSKLEFLKSKTPLHFYLAIRGLFAPSQVAEILNITKSEVDNFIDNLWMSNLPNIDYSLSGVEGAEGRRSDISKLHPIDLLSYLELKFYLQNQLLKDTDFMGMHHSVEIRVPFLDHKLVEYVASLPPEVKMHPCKSVSHPCPSVLKRNRINKKLLILATKDILPQDVYDRDKMGFTFPFQKWLQDSEVSDIRYPISDVAASRQHWSRRWAQIIMNKVR